jgi:hypothetical protein
MKQLMIGPDLTINRVGTALITRQVKLFDMNHGVIALNPKVSGVTCLHILQNNFCLITNSP